tara:strand:- start:347 stop:889 length:543 start_codon:yes stop_codon:yes gene_type:complete
MDEPHGLTPEQYREAEESLKKSQEQYGPVRRRVEKALEDGSDAGIDYLISVANDPDPEEALIGLNALGESNSQKALDFLDGIYDPTVETIFEGAMAFRRKDTDVQHIVTKIERVSYPKAGEGLNKFLSYLVTTPELPQEYELGLYFLPEDIKGRPYSESAQYWMAQAISKLETALGTNQG